MDEENYQRELFNCYMQSSLRGLKQAAKWAAELLHSIPDGNRNLGFTTTLNTSYAASNISLMDTSFMTHTPFMGSSNVMDVDYFLAKSCFDLFEYERAAFITQNSSSQECKFLHFYSRYMAIEKKRQDLLAESSSSNQLSTPANSTSMDLSLGLYKELRNDLRDCCSTEKEDHDEDSYILYVYAIVLLKVDLEEDAISILLRSIKADTSNWASWNQLALVVEDRDSSESLELPSHIFKRFYHGILSLELQQNEEALEVYEPLLRIFEKSNYIKTQIAVAKEHLRDVDGAIEVFREVRSADPFRFESMDVYSNLLYVKDMRADLCILAHELNDIDPFRVETCCCIANFYAIRGQHAKAVLYFTRALQLNPKYLSAWTLMAHEYMEMKNTGAAIQAYRSAIKCNKRDYRAWYGLGQTYEILKMSSYCLYYYTVARSLRPNDSRMTIAMGETLEKLDRISDALKCYAAAGYNGLTKLASLYEKNGEKDKAALAYKDFVIKSDESNVNPLDEVAALSSNASELAVAYKFISSYYFDIKDYEEAYRAAEKCTMFLESKDHGKHLMSQILKAKPNASQTTGDL